MSPALHVLVSIFHVHNSFSAWDQPLLEFTLGFLHPGVNVLPSSRIMSLILTAPLYPSWSVIRVQETETRERQGLWYRISLSILGNWLPGRIWTSYLASSVKWKSKYWPHRYEIEVHEHLGKVSSPFPSTLLRTRIVSRVRSTHKKTSAFIYRRFLVTFVNPMTGTAFSVNLGQVCSHLWASISCFLNGDNKLK